MVKVKITIRLCYLYLWLDLGTSTGSLRSTSGKAPPESYSRAPWLGMNRDHRLSFWYSYWQASPQCFRCDGPDLAFSCRVSLQTRNLRKDRACQSEYRTWRARKSSQTLSLSHLHLRWVFHYWTNICKKHGIDLLLTSRLPQFMWCYYSISVSEIRCVW